MTDILELEGDWLLSSNSLSEYDTQIETDCNTTVKSCLSTPSGSLTEFILDTEQGLTVIDESLGNQTYQKLSEPLTLQIINEINKDVSYSLSQIEEEITVNSVEVSLVSEGILTQVSYTCKNSNFNTSVLFN